MSSQRVQVNQADAVGCTDGCGQTQPDDEAAAHAGWHCLQITNRWRCPACARELQTINESVAGAEGEQPGGTT